MTTNEAAERLRMEMDLGFSVAHRGPLLDEALAEERRATVERIEEAINNPGRYWTHSDAEFLGRILAEAEDDAHWAEHRARAEGGNE